MKTSIIFADGLTQINFTPENDNEKMALKLINAKDQIEVAVHNGTFTDKHTPKPFTASINKCRGGYLRTFSDDDSKMIVLKPREKHSDENDFQDEVNAIKQSLISSDKNDNVVQSQNDFVQIHRDAKECLMMFKYWDDHSIVTNPDGEMVHPLIQDSNVSKVIKTFLEKLINKFPNK